jgi:hypothetical protein
MKSFSERDVRRHYDMLQHDPELGLTELKTLDADNIIGIGLFDNEEDFVAECFRYNDLGVLYVGINPRSLSLLDDYGGLKNRMRTLFMDVVEEKDVDFVTGLILSGSEGLSESARAFLPDVSVLSDAELFFPMDEPLPIENDDRDGTSKAITRWLYGDTSRMLDLAQFTRVMGTAIPGGGWLGRRSKFKNFRPYILDGISSQIVGE